MASNASNAVERGGEPAFAVPSKAQSDRFPWPKKDEKLHLRCAAKQHDSEQSQRRGVSYDKASIDRFSKTVAKRAVTCCRRRGGPRERP